MSELRPCPFCGSPAREVNYGGWYYPDETEPDERVAMCSNQHCGVEIELALWNTRPTDKAQKVVDAAKAVDDVMCKEPEHEHWWHVARDEAIALRSAIKEYEEDV
jgi:hypothetical protein